MPNEDEEEELQLSSSNLSDAAKGKTDTLVMTSGKKGGRKVTPADLPAALMQAGVKKEWQGTLVIAFPDVCKTPSPAGPVPVPYPNLGAGNSQGSSKVKVERSLRQAGFKGVRVTTMGNEAGTMKGIGSRAHAAGAAPFSFDVKVEGKPTTRLLGHEMTHVLQQSHVPHAVPSQRKGPAKP